MHLVKPIRYNKMNIRFMQTNTMEEKLSTTPQTMNNSLTQQENIATIPLGTVPTPPDIKNFEEILAPSIPTKEQVNLFTLQDTVLQTNLQHAQKTRGITSAWISPSTSDGNITLDPPQNPIIPEPPFQESTQAILTTLTGVTHSLELAPIARVKTIAKSQQLATEIYQGLKSLDTAKQNDDFTSWLKRNIFYWSSAIMFIAFFCFRMYQLNAIPNLVGVSAKALSSAISTSVEHTASTLNEQTVQNIISTAINSPLTPITLISTYGGLQVLNFTFRLIRLVLK